MNSKFEITLGADNKFHFYFKTAHNEIILKSQYYTAKHNCKNGIESVKINAKYQKNFEKTTQNKHFSFHLKAGNGQIIAASEHYSSIETRDKALEMVIKQANKAKIIDLTVKKKK